MPQINNVVVTNTNTGVAWTTHNQATVFAAWVACNADAAHQPPVGFLNNPGHNFVITGNNVASGAAYNSGNMQPYAANTEPPDIYAFQ